MQFCRVTFFKSRQARESQESERQKAVFTIRREEACVQTDRLARSRGAGACQEVLVAGPSYGCTKQHITSVGELRLARRATGAVVSMFESCEQLCCISGASGSCGRWGAGGTGWDGTGFAAAEEPSGCERCFCCQRE